MKPTNTEKYNCEFEKLTKAIRNFVFKANKLSDKKVKSISYNEDVNENTSIKVRNFGKRK